MYALRLRDGLVKQEYSSPIRIKRIKYGIKSVDTVSLKPSNQNSIKFLSQRCTYVAIVIYIQYNCPFLPVSIFKSRLLLKL